MPKFIATSGSFFRPYSYDELVKPIAHMQEAHNAAQDAYDTLSLETNALQNYITDNPGDARARALYNNYMDKLSTLQDNLWQNGYNGQTRRDLSAARSAYASDITPIATAIKNRQERSREYWDAKHKNPDLVMGADPGLNGLDDYLGNEEFGRNWYSYNGNTFSQEVGADAKARAGDMLRMPEVIKDPRLVGYLTRIERDGFTNQEVDAAGQAVRAALNGDSSYMSQLDPASSILAGVLMSHLDSTGARGQVSDSEFNRLFNYGMTGLAQAVGKTSVSAMNDKQWDFAKQVALANMRQASTSSTTTKNSKDNDSRSNWPGYSLQSISTYREGQKAKEITNLLNKKVFHPFEEPIPVTGTDGQPDVIANYADASRILSSFGKDALISEYGIDPDKPIRQGKPQDVVSEHGKLRISQAAPSGYGKAPNGYKVSVQKEDGSYEYDPGLSADLTNKYNEYQDKVKTWKKNNKGVNIQNLAINQDDRKAMYDAGTISYDTPFEYVPYILATLAKPGSTSAAQIADHTREHEPIREDYGLAIIRAFQEGPTDRKGRRSKTGDTAFYKVDGYNVSDKGETDIQKVFGTRKEGQNTVPNEKAVSAIYITPEDVVANRVQAVINGQTWAFNPKMLGNDIDAQVSKLTKALEVPRIDANGNYVLDRNGNIETKVIDRQGIINFLMKPIFDPEAAVKMTDEEINDWIYYYNLEAGDEDFTTIITDNNGNVVDLISPADVVMNERLQELVRTNVTKLIDKTIADARDNMVQRSIQRLSGTSGNPTSFNEPVR